MHWTPILSLPMRLFWWALALLFVGAIGCGLLLGYICLFGWWCWLAVMDFFFRPVEFRADLDEANGGAK